MIISRQEIEKFIERAQMTVLPRYAPPENHPLLVITVEGLRSFLNEHRTGVRRVDGQD